MFKSEFEINFKDLWIHNQIEFSYLRLEKK